MQCKIHTMQWKAFRIIISPFLTGTKSILGCISVAALLQHLHSKVKASVLSRLFLLSRLFSVSLVCVHTLNNAAIHNPTHTLTHSLENVFKLAQLQHCNNHAWILYVEGSSPVRASHFLLISHTVIEPQATALKTNQQHRYCTHAHTYTVDCNGKQRLL